MASTITVQQIVNSARAYPELTPILGASGWSQEPAITIANDVMQKFLAQTLNWKFNRAYVPSFLTVAMQQDYPTNVTNLGWLEQGWRMDINNTSAGGVTNAPKPVFAMETVRDLSQTSYLASPFNMSWLPNSLAVLGTWQKSTNYLCGYGQALTPSSPIQSFLDTNGNILFLNSNALGLNLQSPGFFGGTPVPQNGFGLSGTVQPAAAPNATPGTTVTDNQLIWTVADPNGYAMRIVPLPAVSGLTWLVFPVYQKKPPILTSLQNLIAPIPDEFGYLFRQGFIAMAYTHAGSPRAADAYAKWEENIMIALRSGDREREDASFYPSESLMGGGPYKYGMPIGPSWPFDYWGQ